MKNTVEISRGSGESNASIIRRFTKRVQSSSVVKKARSLRYSQRQKSNYKKKKEALTRLTRRAEYERLKKLGKISDERGRR